MYLFDAMLISNFFYLMPHHVGSFQSVLMGTAQHQRVLTVQISFFHCCLLYFLFSKSERTVLDRFQLDGLGNFGFTNKQETFDLSTVCLPCVRLGLALDDN